MKNKNLIIMTVCLLLPLTTYASWWNPTTWNSWSFFGWKITREEPQLNMQENKIPSQEISTSTITNTDTLDSTTTKKVEINSAPDVKKQTITFKKEVQAPSTNIQNIQKQNNPVPIYENVFTSSGYVKIDLNEYTTFRSDDGNRVVYMNKKTGEKIVPKSTQNYDDNLAAQQAEQERINALAKINAQNTINTQNNINAQYQIEKAKGDRCSATLSYITTQQKNGVIDDRTAAVQSLTAMQTPDCAGALPYMPKIDLPKTTNCNLDYAGFGGNYTVSCN